MLLCILRICALLKKNFKAVIATQIATCMLLSRENNSVSLEIILCELNISKLGAIGDKIDSLLISIILTGRLIFCDVHFCKAVIT